MHASAKKMAFGGLMLALTVVCIALGSVIETNTLFLLAAASYFVGIMIRETGFATGTAFYLAGVLLGFFVSPNKLYVVSYAGMGLYILVIELAWKRLGRLSEKLNRIALFWVIKYLVFNLIYISVFFGFKKMLFPGEISEARMIFAAAAGQAGLFLYDRAYEYVQGNIWNKMRGRLF